MASVMAMMESEVEPLICVECGREDDGEPGWKMELADPDELVA